ncbi:MAG: hypothetical protein IJK31_06210 [Ruminococcus sp.]|nr:hypothetical protein [Ruminococcus sp.]HRR78229.1 hypothetical protein [Ruminococcus sp.]
MNEFDVKNTEHSAPAVPYKKFVKQMSKWYSTGELPELASQDLRFVLELQKQKLRSLGLDMKCELKKKGSDRINSGDTSYSDRVFKNTFISGNAGMTRNVVSTQDQLTKYTDDIDLMVIIQELNDGTQPGDDMPLCCPHCGAPSTLGELQAGCKHCGTHFLMSELYPKVMNYFTFENHDIKQTKIKNKHDLTTLIIASIIPMIIICILFNLFAGQAQNTIANVIFGLFGGILGGAMVGGILFVFKKLFESLRLMGKQLRGIGHLVSTLLNADKIKQNDPEFSSEYFRDKITSLFRMAVYSKDATALSCCKCRCPKEAAEIIEARLHNFSIISCQIKDMICDVNLILYLDCLHCRDGKIKIKSDKYRMRMRKQIKTPTGLGFSFSAVSCPSCGASFDARNVKACPYCNNEYLHEEHDWIITDLKRI